MSYRYSRIIQWLDEDQIYLVTIPEFSNIAMQPCTTAKRMRTRSQTRKKQSLATWTTARRKDFRHHRLFL